MYLVSHGVSVPEKAQARGIRKSSVSKMLAELEGAILREVSHARNMKWSLEVDERRELPSSICSENGPFDVTHRQNCWRAANVRGWLANAPEKNSQTSLRLRENLLHPFPSRPLPSFRCNLPVALLLPF